MAHADLMWKLKDDGFDPNRLFKVKAHCRPTVHDDLLAVYHMLGNMIADQTAKHACENLMKPWQQQLETIHSETQKARDVLFHVYQLQLELGKARSELAQQLTRQDNVDIPENAKTNLVPVVQALSTWTPTEVQVLVFPETPDTWSCSFSWGQSLAEQLFQWIQMLQWLPLRMVLWKGRLG